MNICGAVATRRKNSAHVRNRHSDMFYNKNLRFRERGEICETQTRYRTLLHCTGWGCLGATGWFMPAVWDHFQDCKHGERDTLRSPALKGGSFEMLEPVGVPFAPQCPHPPLPPRLLSSPCFLLSWLDSFDRFTTLGSKFFDSSR